MDAQKLSATIAEMQRIRDQLREKLGDSNLTMVELYNILRDSYSDMSLAYAEFMAIAQNTSAVVKDKQ